MPNGFVHEQIWQRLQRAIQHNRFPAALLLVGPRHLEIEAFANRLIASLLCERHSHEGTNSGKEQRHPELARDLLNEAGSHSRRSLAALGMTGEQVPYHPEISCLCRSCQSLQQGMHPDVAFIRPESASSSIKIEQVRELQQTIYQTPQRGARRFIVFDPVDKLNVAAANAMLKILEEPPSHLTFILRAEQLSTLPVTIISRCQQTVFPDPTLLDTSIDYLTLTTYYQKDSPRAELIKQVPEMITSLNNLILLKESPCEIAANWATYAFEEVIWLLCLLTSQAIYGQLVSAHALAQGVDWEHFTARLPTIRLFDQLERIYGVMQNLNHNLNMNQTLVLENLLFGFLPEGA